MTDKIGALKQKVQFIYKNYEQVEEGCFEEKHVDGPWVWSRVQVCVKGEKRMYKVAMRKNNSRDALQANLFGLRFNSRVHKITSPFMELQSWIEGYVDGDK